MKWNDNWRSVVRIAKIELNTMFYSPVAWLILVVFAFQTGLTYSGLINDLIHQQAMGKELSGITGRIFGAKNAIGGMMTDNFFSNIIDYLYLYLPLLTMGLLSREYSTGSVKLLFSAPVPNRAIVLGKFGAMLVYGGLLTGIMACYIVYSGCVIENFDWGQAWVGLLGVFLLICTYSAIGLFMSSLTGYPVVAAIGTLAFLAFLNYVGEVGQGIGFVRDITYWLALSGKTRDFILGIIPSESVIYFVALILFFLYITLLRLEDKRTSRGRTRMMVRYALAAGAIVVVSWVSSRPSCKFYYDATAIRSNTLSRESQEVVKQMEGPLKITTYVNMLDSYLWREVLPVRINEDKRRFEQYTRFKPEIEMEYVYYWDEANNPGLQQTYPDLSNRERAELICQTVKVDFESVLTPEQIKARVDLSGVGNHVVRLLERGEGQQDFLPLYQAHRMHPSEKEITTVFKHLIGQKVSMGFVEGHGERCISNPSSRGYWWNTSNLFQAGSLVAMGFEVMPLYLENDVIPEDLDVLVLSSLQTPLSETECQRIKEYIDKGGDLMLLTEAGWQQHSKVILDELELSVSKEIAVCDAENPSVIQARIAEEALDFFPDLREVNREHPVAMQKDVPAIDVSGVKDFRVVPLVVSPAEGVWLEKETRDIGEEPVVFHPEAGEKEGAYNFLVALERQVGEKSQRILVASTPAWFSSEHSRLITDTHNSATSWMYPVLMRWFSQGEFPASVKRDLPEDNRICLRRSHRTVNSWVMLVLFPGLILGMGWWIIKRRQRA